MSSPLFRIKEHVVPCQHIRQYPHAIRGDREQEDVLHLSVKQYTPLSNLNPRSGDVTIIGGHANGFPKELYEPLWEDMLQLADKAGFRVRNIWIADVAHQGQGNVLNEDKLGNDPSWFDHPRDLLHMINHFRAEMPRPFIGVGHSMGGAHLVKLSLMHPRLFQTLVLIDPVIQRFSSPSGNYSPALASSVRRDRWPSRSAARKAFLRSQFYQKWDPRVFDRWITYGLRDLPTALYPNAQPSSVPPPATADPSATTTSQPEKEVTLCTTKHNEVLTFLRHHPVQYDSSGHVVVDPNLERLKYPDYDFQESPAETFYRAEPLSIFQDLPFVRPSVLYIFGTDSHLSAPALRADKLACTGVGISGSGGVKQGRVKEVVLEKVGHLIPMERVGETATASTEWIGQEMERWRRDEEMYAKMWAEVPKGYENRLSPRFVEDLKVDTKKQLEDEKNGKAHKERRDAKL